MLGTGMIVTENASCRVVAVGKNIFASHFLVANKNRTIIITI